MELKRLADLIGFIGSYYWHKMFFLHVGAFLVIVSFVMLIMSFQLKKYFVEILGVSVFLMSNGLFLSNRMVNFPLAIVKSDGSSILVTDFILFFMAILGVIITIIGFFTLVYYDIKENGLVKNDSANIDKNDN